MTAWVASGHARYISIKYLSLLDYRGFVLTWDIAGGRKSLFEGEGWSVMV